MGSSKYNAKDGQVHRSKKLGKALHDLFSVFGDSSALWVSNLEIISKLESIKCYAIKELALRNR